MKFTAVLVQENMAWVAQCLEVDIAAQGQTQEEALRRLGETILVGQIAVDRAHGQAPLVDTPPTPERYFFKGYPQVTIEVAVP